MALFVLNETTGCSPLHYYQLMCQSLRFGNCSTKMVVIWPWLTFARVAHGPARGWSRRRGNTLCAVALARSVTRADVAEMRGCTLERRHTPCFAISPRFDEASVEMRHSAQCVVTGASELGHDDVRVLCARQNQLHFNHMIVSKRLYNIQPQEYTKCIARPKNTAVVFSFIAETACTEHVLLSPSYNGIVITTFHETKSACMKPRGLPGFP